jgi:hypothetical protein
MFLSEHSTDGGGLDRAEKKAGQREWQEFTQLLITNRGQRRQRKAAWNLAQELNAVRAHVQHRRGDNAGDHNEKRDWLTRQQFFSDNQKRESRAAE